jgi:hypothetical protein
MSIVKPALVSTIFVLIMQVYFFNVLELASLLLLCFG